MPPKYKYAKVCGECVFPQKEIIQTIFTFQLYVNTLFVGNTLRPK